MTTTTAGRVFNIQRYSLHDGEGIRTLVFLKGCPLCCLWCSNPESQHPAPELGYIATRCTGEDECGAPCIAACLEGAAQLNAEGKLEIDRAKCDQCGKCVEACPHAALQLVGREMSVPEVMAEVEKDRPFYRRSGGGLTLGGGEPLAQPHFATELLEAACEEYIHTALETSGFAPWKHLEAALQYVDVLHIDLKHIDPVKHKEFTGASNERILNNLRRVLSVKDPEDVIVRIPVIPGMNDDEENLSGSAKFLVEQGYRQVEIMPYHQFGVGKYTQYGMVYALDEIECASDSDLKKARKFVERFGLQEVTGQF